MRSKKDYLSEEPSDEVLKSIEAEIENDLMNNGAEDAEEEATNYPQKGVTYTHKDKLTIDIDNQPVTRKLNDWVRMDPVSFHKALLNVEFQVSRENYCILMSGLRANHFDYYKKNVGLDILVEIPGQQPLAAKGMYNYEPVKFYKWWASNENKVYMTTREKIQLFLRVENIKKGTLLKKHLEFMNNLRAPK